MSERTIHLTEQEFRKYLNDSHIEGGLAAFDVLAEVITELRGKLATDLANPPGAPRADRARGARGMRRDEALNAVQTGARARAAWGYPHDHSSTRAEGKVIAYSDQPQVLIETDAGERVWWVADLVYPALAPEPTDDVAGAQRGGEGA